MLASTSMFFYGIQLALPSILVTFAHEQYSMILRMFGWEPRSATPRCGPPSFNWAVFGSGIESGSHRTGPHDSRHTLWRSIWPPRLWRRHSWHGKSWLRTKQPFCISFFLSSDSRTWWRSLTTTWFMSSTITVKVCFPLFCSPFTDSV
jgi:hypothetical protein